MRGELLNVWNKVWSEIFVKLTKHKEAPTELFSELYDALIARPSPPQAPAEPTHYSVDGELTDPSEILAEESYQRAITEYNRARVRYEQAVTDPAKARRWLKSDLKIQINSEPRAISALGLAFERIRDICEDEIANYYFLLVEKFIDTYSLRYDLRRPFSLHPTVSGIFSQMVGSIKAASLSDAHLNCALLEFEDALRDLQAIKLRLGSRPVLVSRQIFWRPSVRKHRMSQETHWE